MPRPFVLCLTLDGSSAGFGQGRPVISTSEVEGGRWPSLRVSGAAVGRVLLGGWGGGLELGVL